MQYHHSLRHVFALTLAAFLFTTCDKDPREAAKFPRADQGSEEHRVSELAHIELENGISVYLQEEQADEQVAIEVFYRAGFIHEPSGQTQVSHVTEHLVVHSATKSYQPDEAMDRVSTYGAIAAEAIGDCSHFDYIVPADKLDEVLAIEAERLTTIKFHTDVLAAEAKRASAEIDRILASESSSLSRFSMMTLNQVINYGATFVPIYNSAFDITTGDIESFHNAFYRPDDMVIILIGGFDMADGERLVRKHFEGIERRPTPPVPTKTVPAAGDITVNWDIKSEVVYLVYPGPYGDFKERLTMTIFGSFLRRYISDSPSMRLVATTSYVTNPVYPVRDLPFFVYAENQENNPVGELRIELTRMAEGAVEALNATIWPRLVTNVKSFVNATMIRNTGVYIPRRNLIGQEALNVGLKHMFREGMSNDEFFALLDSITFEEAIATIEKHVNHDNMRRVTLKGRE